MKKTNTYNKHLVNRICQDQLNLFLILALPIKFFKNFTQIVNKILFSKWEISQDVEKNN